MNASSSYLIHKLSDYLLDEHDISIVIKNFYVSDTGHKIWFEQDRSPHQKYAKRMFVGITSFSQNYCMPTMWFRTKQLDRAMAFEYQWNAISTLTIPLDMFAMDEFNSIADTIMTQLLLKIDAGNDIWLMNYDRLFKKNTTYEIMLERDLLDESENKSEQIKIF